MQETSVIILCGGRGRRLGKLSDDRPKALAPVLGHPILWYALLRLHKAGFRHFILPLGYRGAQIQAYVDHELTFFDARIDAINTGEETNIARRINMVSHLFQGDNVLIVNGDTLFDFDVAMMVAMHRDSDAELTMSSCSIISQYGLIISDGGLIVDFTRDSSVQSFGLTAREDVRGYVNAGLTCVKRCALGLIDLDQAENFENELFPRVIARNRARHHIIDGYWQAVDTAKDLDVINSRNASDPRARGAAALRQALLQYSFTLGTGG